MSPEYVWTIVVLMAIANFVVRFFPIALVSRLELPESVTRWLGFVPAAVMGALVAGEILRPGGEYLISPGSPYLLAAVPTGLVFYFTRSFLGATVSGMALFVLARTLVS